MNIDWVQIQKEVKVISLNSSGVGKVTDTTSEILTGNRPVYKYRVTILLHYIRYQQKIAYDRFTCVDVTRFGTFEKLHCFISRMMDRTHFLTSVTYCFRLLSCL